MECTHLTNANLTKDLQGKLIYKDECTRCFDGTVGPLRHVKSLHYNEYQDGLKGLYIVFTNLLNIGYRLKEATRIDNKACDR